LRLRWLKPFLMHAVSHTTCDFHLLIFPPACHAGKSALALVYTCDVLCEQPCLVMRM